MTIEKLKDKLHDKIEIHVCEVEENTLIAQGMLKALGMMDEVLEKAEQEPTDKSNLEKICEELAAENDDLRDQLAMRDRFKQEPCDDAVSRQEVLDLVNSDWKYKGLKADIESLPHVRPQEPKTGHWITEDMFDGDVAYRCSECNELFWIESGTPKDNEYNFCPKCGKKLVEPQESEDK